MNQILICNHQPNKNEKQNIPSLQKKHKFFKLQFLVCSFLAFCFLISYTYSLYDNNQKEKLSKKLVDNFTITQLYSNQMGYEATRTSLDTTYEEANEQFKVLGLIEINSININYPILSNVSEELLKIAPCKFDGPNPNEIGNLCIAGHNYKNYKFFSKLKKLNLGDTINIYDLTGNKIIYEIYDSYETDWQDFSCTNQDTNGKREVTLITCNNIKNRRRVIKAIQKG